MDVGTLLCILKEFSLYELWPKIKMATIILNLSKHTRTTNQQSKKDKVKEVKDI